MSTAWYVHLVGSNGIKRWPTLSSWKETNTYGLAHQADRHWGKVGYTILRPVKINVLFPICTASLYTRLFILLNQVDYLGFDINPTSLPMPIYHSHILLSYIMSIYKDVPYCHISALYLFQGLRIERTIRN